MARSAYPEQLDVTDIGLSILEDEEDTCVRKKQRKAPKSARSIIKSNWKRFAKLAGMALLGLAVYQYISAAPVVTTASVKNVIATQTLSATGKVRAERVADLGLDAPGVIRQIYVREGDTVKAGQLMMSLDTSEMDQRVAGAQASVNSAMAELSKASRGPLQSEVARARAELAQAVSVGQARVAQAQARLRNIQAGTRSQEIAAAQAELQSRKDLLAKAQSDLKRTQKLVSQGALARTAAEDGQVNVETSKSAVIAQQERLNLLKEGATSNQIAEVRAAVEEAKATRDTSVRAARESLNILLANPRPEDIRAARSRVDEAQVELRRNMDMRAKSNLRAPFDGAVASIPVEEGQSVSPGQKLISFYETSRPVIEVETDEANLSELAIGQKATLTADAFPGKSFEATVTDLGSEVNSERGTVTIKLRPLVPVSWLKPDLTVDVNIVTGRAVQSLMVPTDSLTRYQGSTAVLITRGGKAIPVPVQTGATGPNGVVVKGDLQPGNKVARNARQVQPNGNVRVTGE